MTTTEAISNEIQEMKNEIQEMEDRIDKLEERIQQKTNELKCVCTHENLNEEYDDDFHRPHCYYICIDCGIELNINYKRQTIR